MRGAGHLPDYVFVCRNPDKVVKVDALRVLGGDGLHAEKQPSRWDREGERGDTEENRAKSREKIGGRRSTRNT